MATTKLILYIGRLFIYSAKVEKRNGDEKKNGQKINVQFSFSQNSFVNKGRILDVLTKML